MQPHANVVTGSGGDSGNAKAIRRAVPRKTKTKPRRSLQRVFQSYGAVPAAPCAFRRGGYNVGGRGGCVSGGIGIGICIGTCGGNGDRHGVFPAASGARGGR